jgi:hypothetical protein
MFKGWREAHRAKGCAHLQPRWEASRLDKDNKNSSNNDNDIINPSDRLASHS